MEFLHKIKQNYGTEKETVRDIRKFHGQYYRTVEKNGQYRTMLHYRATQNSIMQYRDGKDLTLSEIDADLVKSYEAYLKNVVGVCRNTSSFYLRIFRAVYNKAVGKGYAVEQKPLKHVYTGIDTTRKRAVSADMITV